MSIAQLKLGPADHGRELSLDDYESADYEPGFKYEIIDGRLYVSPTPNPPENFLEMWLYRALLFYSHEHPDVINYLSTKSRVFIPRRKKATAAEPDIAAYSDYPLGKRLRDIRWQDTSPLLVAEVLVDGSPEKDLDRNLDLYLEQPSVREYWVLDGRDEPDEPTLIQHRRYGKRWVVRNYAYGSTFATKLLPGFSLLIDPRK
ncbi:MAG TPA: Uma2 family endonuclease [Gemmataceae bacterium]|nr:Uma2 family endonuclease [Gemmataceae bacterium]